jgi:hypothetical protein
MENYPGRGIKVEGLFALFALAHFLAWIVAMFWVYSDAEERGQSGCLMSLLVFFVGWVGIIIWLVLRQSYERMDQYESRTTTVRTEPLQPAETPGKSFYRLLNNNYWLWKNEQLTDDEFQNRKSAAIETLKEIRVKTPVNDFLGELIPFVESGILTKDDIGRIEFYVSGAYREGQQKFRVKDRQLIEDYLSTLETALREELERRGLPTDPVQLVAELDTPRLIDLYRKIRAPEMAQELRNRNLNEFI